MLSQEEARYGLAKPGGDRCEECKWFRPPRACEIVEGRISPGGWSKVFHRKTRRVSDDEGRAYVRQMRGRA